MYEVQTIWFDNSNDTTPSTLRAAVTDMAFMLKQHENPRPIWTSFNQKYSEVTLHQTTIGYLPSIQAPAHDIDTLNTVVQRILILHVVNALQ